MPIFSPPGPPDLNKTPVQGMTPQLQQQIQQLMAQNPELYPHSAVGQNIDPAELNQFNQSQAQSLAAKRQAAQQQGLGGVADQPSYAIDRIRRD